MFSFIDIYIFIDKYVYTHIDIYTRIYTNLHLHTNRSRAQKASERYSSNSSMSSIKHSCAPQTTFYIPRPYYSRNTLYPHLPHPLIHHTPPPTHFIPASLPPSLLRKTHTQTPLHSPTTPHPHTLPPHIPQQRHNRRPARCHTHTHTLAHTSAPLRMQRP